MYLCALARMEIQQLPSRIEGLNAYAHIESFCYVCTCQYVSSTVRVGRIVSAAERVSACVCNHQELSAHLLVTRAERESACVCSILKGLARMRSAFADIES